MDYIDELHSLYLNRRPCSAARCYTYRTNRTVHLHFSSKGCRFARCICCDYGCSQAPLSKKDIDAVLDKEFGNADSLSGSILLGSLGSLLDPDEFGRDLLTHLLKRIDQVGIEDVIVESSWWGITDEVVDLVVGSLPNARVTFECGLESANASVRSICYGKPVSDGCVTNSVQTIQSAGARASANITLGAPFLSVEERIQDAVDSILWTLNDAGMDEAVLFPLNIRPYTAVRALYDMALYEPTGLWEVVEVLLRLPASALARTHLAWWGDRSTDYSLENIAPHACDSCEHAIHEAFREYMDAASPNLGEAAARRREILNRLAESTKRDYDCTTCFPQAQVPSQEEIARRRAETCERARRGGNAHLVWVSPRESDLNTAANLFVGSSTVYGSNKDGNKSYSSKTGWRENHNDVTQEQINTMARDQVAFAKSDGAVRFMSYNPYYSHGGNPLVLDRSICLNDADVLRLFADKRSFRQFAQGVVSVPDFRIMRRSECAPKKLAGLFPNGTVIQRGISSGGEGTFVAPPHQELLADLSDADEKLLVSRHYASNIPVNVHAVVFDQEIVILPASTQLIDSRDGKLLYCGCDFVSFNDLSAHVRDDFARQTRALCKLIQTTGYRGVLGLDALVIDSGILFLEMNARFQASSNALNHALSDAGLPTLHQLQREAFTRARPSVDAERLQCVEVAYSSFAYSSRGSAKLDAPYEHLLKAARTSSEVEVFDDGLDLSQPRRMGAHLFSILLKGRISSIFFDAHINVNQNVSCWGDAIPTQNLGDNDSWMRLKIALLNQGCVISKGAKAVMEAAGGVREGVNDAIDLELLGHVVNVPIGMPHQEFSPYELVTVEGGGLEIRAYGSHVAPVEVSYRDQVQGLLTPSGVPVDRICLLATDRVRVQHHDCCDLVEQGLRCKFCNFPAGRAGFGLDDIDFAVDAYLASGIPFRHFLVGGGSDLSPESLENTLAVIRSIRSRCNKPIYLMDMPSFEPWALERLREAGVTEVGFNMEVFDRHIASELMPYKGELPMDTYLELLEAAVGVWGANGEVRSALVVGIEGMSSTLAGVEALASRGVAPILSVFRPVAGSPMADSVGPDNAWLYQLYRKASAICAKYGLELGPQCEECRNNVLAP